MRKHFNNIISHPLPDNVPKIFSKAIKSAANFHLKLLEHKMNQFINIDKNLPQKSNREKRHANIFKSIDPINSEVSLDGMLNFTQTKIKIFHSLIYQFNSLNDNSTEVYYAHSRNKRQVLEALKAISDVLGTFHGTFSAHEILELRPEMGAYLHKFNFLAQITSRQDKQIATLQSSMKVVFEDVDTLAQDHPELISLALDEQLSIFDQRVDNTMVLFELYTTTMCKNTISKIIN